MFTSVQLCRPDGEPVTSQTFEELLSCSPYKKSQKKIQLAVNYFLIKNAHKIVRDKWRELEFNVQYNRR